MLSASPWAPHRLLIQSLTGEAMVSVSLTRPVPQMILTVSPKSTGDPGHRAGGVSLSRYITFAPGGSREGPWEPVLPSFWLGCTRWVPWHPPGRMPASGLAACELGCSLMRSHLYFQLARKGVSTQVSQQSLETATAIQHGQGMISYPHPEACSFAVLYLDPKNM